MEEKEQKQKKSVTERGQEAVDKARQAKDTVKKVQDAKKAADAAKAGKAAAQAGKAAAHGSKILTALGPALPYIGIALLVILIIILLIGIIVFLVTMPGMVMEKLKAMFQELGSKVAAFFGGDTTEQIEDEEVYEILDYLQDMGYDLKGYGFLTEFMTDSDMQTYSNDKGVDLSNLEVDNGVVRNTEEDKIVKAESQFIFTYIMSDNYVYTVKNYNVINNSANSDGFWKKLWGGIVAIGQKFAGIFVDQGAIWGKGMIYLEKSDGSEWQNGLKVENWWGFPVRWETIYVDASTKTMKITRGAFANAMEFSLDGWTGRYGMPLEFLLSVHIATNMPDLAYDMVEFFGTEVVIRMADATAEVDSEYREVNGKRINYKDMNTIKSEGWWITDGWTLSKEEAFKIMALGLESPEGCTGTSPTFELIDATDNGDGWIFDTNNKATLEMYGFTGGELDSVDDDMSKSVAGGTEEKFKSKEAMIELHDENSKGTKYSVAAQYGYDYNTCNNAGGYEHIKETINGSTKSYSICDGTNHTYGYPPSSDYITCHVYGYNYPTYYYSKAGKIYYQIEKNLITREWSALNDAGEDSTYQWVSYVYKVYSYTNEARTEGKTYINSYIIDYVLRDYTLQELKDKGLIDDEGNATETTCSQLAHSGSDGKCCGTCKKYVRDVIEAAKEVYETDMATYTPYIRRVQDHWYRDVYFEFEGNINAVTTDEEYEILMSERWTDYKVYGDDDEFAGNTIWYILGKTGEYIKDFSDAARTAYDTVVIDGETVQVQEVDTDKVLKDSDGYCYYHVETADECKLVGLSVSRKAITEKKTGSSWSAYDKNTDITETGDWEQAYPNSDDEIERRVYLKTTIHGGKKQVEEGVRTETNEKIKRIFAINSYFRYDGNPDTAEIIYNLRHNNNKGKDLGYGNLNGDEGGASGNSRSKGSESTLKENLALTTKFTLEGDDTAKTYTVKDYSGQLDLTKDSLAAFSMLENTHTVDADYIYKDFKELIVELGYFEKEELAEHVPEIFQWFIPEIGSYGYPLRFADKKENMYGTMAHSYDDYLALKEISIAAAVATDPEASGEGFGVPRSYDSEESENAAMMEITEREEDRVTEETRGIGNLLNSTNNANVQTVSGAFDEFTNVSADEMQLIRATNNTSKGVSPSSVSLEEFLQTTREMCEYINAEGYDYCVYKPIPGGSDYRAECTCESNEACMEAYRTKGRSWICNATGCGCETNHCKHNVHENECSLPTTFEASKATGKHNFCCATLVAWALQNVGVMPDADHMDGAESLATYVEDVLGAEKIEKTEELKEGDILVYFGHVDLVGEKKDSGFVKYNGGHHVPAGAVEGGTSSVEFGGSCIEYISDWPANADYALRLNWGRNEDGVYEGYKGGEAVVSPATGILLEYGEYTGIKPEYAGTEMAAIQNTSIDSVAAAVPSRDVQAVDADGNVAAPNAETNGETAEETITSEDKGDRLNYDLRYPFNGVTGTGQAEAAGANVTSGGEQIQPREVYDKVGYAKILVLDDTFYKRLEEHFGVTGNNSYQLQHGYKDLSLTMDDIKTWTENQITLYGYKEFVEKYDAFDLGGYIIYIDGFECELPNPEYDPEEPGDTDPSGEELTYDILMSKAATYEQSMYEPADIFQLSSTEATEKLKAEETIKSNAQPLIKVSYTDPEDSTRKDCLFIKEGTVIGRTLTDKEVVTARGETYVEPKDVDELEEGEEVKREIIGNYIRIVMRDRDDTVVENVEDYLKLDEIPPAPELEMEKFLYWMGVYVEGGNKVQVGGKWVSKAVDLNDGVGATHYFGLTKYCKSTAEDLGYTITNWGDDQDMEMLVNTYLARIEEDKEYVKEQLGDDIEDGYLQAFISIKHNYGNLTKRGTEYKNKGSVSESTWTTYEGTQYAAALTKRRISEWKIISEGRYTECYSDPDKDLVFESETPFTDWCAEMGITVSLKAAGGE